MTLNVLWWSMHDNVLARGYWDQSQLEDVLGGRAWSWKQDGVRHFVPHDMNPRWDDPLAIVVPARHHASERDVAQLAEAVNYVARPVVFLMGDEAHEFPLRAFLDRIASTVPVWVQNPSIDVARGHDRVLGCGYTMHVRAAALGTPTKLASLRDFAWSFSGQVTHPRRHEMWQYARRTMASHQHLPHTTLATKGFTQGQPREAYAEELLDSRVVLAPAGPLCPDTFRLFEALEAGAIPIGDEWSKGGDHHGYWRALFGDTPRFPIVEQWSELPGVVDDLTNDWTRKAAATLAWWGRYKARTARRILDDLGQSSGVDDEITVLIPTSIVPSSPSIAGVTQTIDSVRSYLPHARILVLADGVRAEQAGSRHAWNEAVYRMAWEASTLGWSNVEVLPFDEHQHQALMTRVALAEVTTPYVLFVEHDTPLCGALDFAELVAPLRSGALNMLRFHHEAGIHPEHAWLSPSVSPVDVDGVPVVHTMQWSQRPHLARTEWYRELMKTYFGWQSRTFIEDVMHGVCEVHWREHGRAAVDEWRMAVYAPSGSYVRHRHSDLRGSDPKFPQTWAYDTERTPWGAPTPRTGA